MKQLLTSSKQRMSQTIVWSHTFGRVISINPVSLGSIEGDGYA